MKPVDVGDLLRFRSRVIHTQQPDQLPGTVSVAKLLCCKGRHNVSVNSTVDL